MLLLPCSNLLVKLAKRMIPGEETDQGAMEDKTLLYVRRNGKFRESTALIDSIQEIERMALMVHDNLLSAMDTLLNGDLERIEKIKSQERYIDYLSNEITEYLVDVNKMQLPLSNAARIGGLFHVVIDIERIGDHSTNIARSVEE